LKNIPVNLVVSRSPQIAMEIMDVKKKKPTPHDYDQLDLVLIP